MAGDRKPEDQEIWLAVAEGVGHALQVREQVLPRVANGLLKLAAGGRRLPGRQHGDLFQSYPDPRLHLLATRNPRAPVRTVQRLPFPGRKLANDPDLVVTR